MTKRLIQWCSLLLVLLVSADACKVPVFRYALERWVTDEYSCSVFYDGSDAAWSGQSKKLLETEMEAGELANMSTLYIDVSKLREHEKALVPGLSQASSFPFVQLYYPQKNGEKRLAIASEWDPGVLSRLIESPLRKQISGDILSGQSAVWVLVEGDDAAENDALALKLRAILDEAQSEIELPHGVVRKDEGKAYLEANPGALPEDVLKSDIPLNIEFSIARLKQADPSEDYLWAVVKSQSDIRDGEAYLFPVFGRGRMLPAFSGRSLNKQLVMKGCQYLLGECSCEVKAQNPGVDLLMAVDWDKAIEGTQVIQEMELPPLEGAVITEESTIATEVIADDELERGKLFNPWSWVLMGFIAIASYTVVLLRKKG